MSPTRHSVLILVAALSISAASALAGFTCPADCGDGDGNVGTADLLALLGGWGNPGTCDLDQSGDIGTADLLALLGKWGTCPAPNFCGAGAGTCCAANGTPGCVDIACCGAVCASDPYCCDEDWDAACAAMAQAVCDCSAGACGPGSGTCCAANGTPGCEDEACCQTVCATDAYCCDQEWDTQCADAALAACDCSTGPCGPGHGNCCVQNGTPGCQDVACCEAVCAADPFCCDVDWDGLCVDHASTLCGCP